MQTIVTAVLVAREGGEWLDQTLAALREQTRRPDRLVAVDAGGGERVARQLEAGGAQLIVTATKPLHFGEAVKRGVAAMPGIGAEAGVGTAAVATWEKGAGSGAVGTGVATADSMTAAPMASAPTTPGSMTSTPMTPTPTTPGAAPAETEEWLWLLAEDSAPEPEALERILDTVQRAPSVVLAGPKLVDWDHPGRIIELGQSLTSTGDRWVLRRQELDQQQYDHLQDVLGVGPVGMLVRRDIWQRLGGFDPALPVFDDGLDLSVRARRAGYRVVVAPASRIRFARSGVAGPRIDRSRAVLRVAHRQARTAHLHRRISYAPGIFAFFMWLGLPLVAIARVAWALIREQPGQMWGEFAAALRVFFTPASIIASRRRLAKHNEAGWAAVRPLRVDRKTVRTARMVDREAILAAQGRPGHELHFISSGGLAVLVASAVAAVVLCWWAIPRTSLFGGAIAPLSPIGELWRNTLTQNGVPADPYTWVLALLGSFTFWNTSHAVVLLLIAAIPLATLGGWIWGAQLTESKAGRALIGLGWALSPVLLGSLGAGRLSTTILAVALPWLLLAAARCRESWSWAGTASLLAAVVLACAPVLIPAALLLLVIGVASSVRGIARVLTTAIAPLVLFAPKLISLIGGQPIDLLIDPGITPVFRPGTVWHLMLGFPEFGLAGWGPILDMFGLGDAPATLLVGVLLLPIVLLAALGLFTGRIFATLLSSLLGGLGLFTALASAQLQLVGVGPDPVAIWTGSGLALYWIGVLSLAAVGCTVLARAATPIVSVALVAALVAVAPLAVRLVLGQTGLQPGEAQMPAIVQAAGESDPETRTLVLTALGDRDVRAELETGAGTRLDDLRTADRVPETTEQDRWIADLVGRLASTGDDAGLQSALAERGVGFVLLRDSGDSAERAQFQAVLDRSAALSSAGQTGHGLLWRLQGDVSASSEQPPSTARVLEGTSFSGRTIWWVQLAVLFGMVLLALPTGEVVERPERRRRGSKTPQAVAGAGSVAAVAPVAPAEGSDATAPSAPVGPSAPVAPADLVAGSAPVAGADTAAASAPVEGTTPGKPSIPVEASAPVEGAAPAAPSAPVVQSAPDVPPTTEAHAEADTSDAVGPHGADAAADARLDADDRGDQVDGPSDVPADDSASPLSGNPAGDVAGTDSAAPERDEEGER